MGFIGDDNGDLNVVDGQEIEKSRESWRLLEDIINRDY